MKHGRPPRRVMIVSPDPELTPGGVATFTRALSSRTGWGIYVSHAEQGGNARFLGQLGSLLGFVRATGAADVVYLQASEHLSVIRKSVYAAVARLRGQRAVLHLHAATLPKPGSLRFQLAFALAKLLRLDVICLSRYWEGLLRDGGLRRLHVVPNPVLDDRLYEVPPLSRSAGGPLKVMFLGRIGTRKGADVLLEALRSPALGQVGVEVAFAGDGDLNGLCVDGLAPGVMVRSLGWVNEAQRMQALAEAHVVCLPSRAEGMPLSLIEGAAAGRLIVGSDIPPITAAFTWFGDGVFHFRSEDAADLAHTLLEVASLEPDEAQRRGEANRRAAQAQLSMDAFLTRVRDILDINRGEAS